jgi:NAD(P)-dependent dehydrogenase (short-subunit alcohol dehydrogenase family)
MDPSAVVLKEFSWSNPKKRLFEDYTREAIDPSTSVDRLRELASAGWPWLVSFHPSLPQRDQRSFKKRRPSEVELAAIAATSNPRVINFVVSKGSRSKSHRLAARAVAANPHITKRASVTLAKSSSLGLRLILANNAGIAPQARMILSGDEHIWIRRAIEDSSAAATDARNFVDLFTFKSLNKDQ